jgi:hypothetical protein
MKAERLANRATITDDPFIAFFINDLLRSLRTQYIIDLIKPYTRLELDFLAKVRSDGLCFGNGADLASQSMSVEQKWRAW